MKPEENREAATEFNPIEEAAHKLANLANTLNVDDAAFAFESKSHCYIVSLRKIAYEDPRT